MRRSPARPRRLRWAAATAAALVAAFVALPAQGAVAATATGWLRVAHLSPDTGGVDVTVSGLSGGSIAFTLDDVSYGGVSKYIPLADGPYVVAMRPAGASASSAPVLKATVDVNQGTASTLAVFGDNANLDPTVLHDDLTPPPSGDARVRIVDASTKQNAVTVTTSTGDALASDAHRGAATAYSTVPAKTWALTAAGGSVKATGDVPLKNGQVATVFVLDTASGGLAMRTVIDSASVGAMPAGFLATGGGFLAKQAEADQRLAAESALAAAALVVATGVVAVRRRRALSAAPGPRA